MKKHIFHDCLSLILVAAMIFSISVNAFAANTDNQQTSKVKEISQSLRVKTEDAEVEKPLVSVYVANADLKEPVISIVVDNAFLQKCPELRVNVSCEGKKNAIYEDVLYIGKESITIKELTTETTYYITAQGTHDISVDNFIGYFLLHEKNDELSVEYKITHETQMIREYNETYVRELNRASDLLQEANDKYGCYNKEKALLDDRAAPISEIEILNYAATLLAEYATASVRYEAEPNNTMAQADRVYDDDTTYGTIGYSGDVDYYKVQFTSAGNANFWLGDIPSGQDYDFYLYDASGNLLQRSETTSNQEQIYNYPVTANTWYYMKVIGYNGSYNASSYYQVRAKNYPTVQSGDSYEPNNTFSAATSISNTATITSANIHDSSDVDYYRFTIPSTSSISISLSNIPTNCDYDLVLYNSSQTQCASSANGGNSSESISYSAAPGTYYIKVYSYSGSSSSNYRLTINASINYPPDSYEPNNTIQSPTNIVTPITLYGTIHSSTDTDYYRFVVSTVSIVRIDLANIPSACDYDLKLLNGSYSVISSSGNRGNSPETIVTTLSPGIYYINVYPYTGSSNVPYRLSVTTTPLEHSYSIRSYVDEGYSIRFPNSISVVEGHMGVVKRILEQLFDVNISCSAYAYTSFADDCKVLTDGEVTTSNLYQNCTHSPTHLSTSALRTELISDIGAGTPTLSRVLWTGHILSGNPASNSVFSNQTVIITPKHVVDPSTYDTLSNSTVNRESRYTLLHETSHQLSAPDHYCYGVPSGATHCSNPDCCSCNGLASPNCIMQSRKDVESTATASLYCSDCIATIDSHISDHH